MESRIPAAHEHFWGEREPEASVPPELPLDVLTVVAQKLKTPRELANFASVSKTTRSAVRDAGREAELRAPRVFGQLIATHLQEQPIGNRSEVFYNVLKGAGPVAPYLSRKNQRFTAHYGTLGFHPFGSDREMNAAASILTDAEPALRRKLMRWVTSLDEKRFFVYPHLNHIHENFAAYLPSLRRNEKHALATAIMRLRDPDIRGNAFAGLVPKADSLDEGDQLALVRNIFAVDTAYALGRNVTLLASNVHRFCDSARALILSKIADDSIPPGFVADIHTALLSSMRKMAEHAQLAIASEPQAPVRKPLTAPELRTFFSLLDGGDDRHAMDHIVDHADRLAGASDDVMKRVLSRIRRLSEWERGNTLVAFAAVFDRCSVAIKAELLTAFERLAAYDTAAVLKNLGPGLLARDDDFQRRYFRMLKAVPVSESYGKVIASILPALESAADADWKRLQHNFAPVRIDGWAPWLRHHAWQLYQRNDTIVHGIVYIAVLRLWNRTEMPAGAAGAVP